MRFHRVVAIVAAFGLVIGAIVAVPGCDEVSPEERAQFTALIAQGQEQIDTLKAELAKAKAAFEASQDESEKAKALATIEKIEGAIAKVETAIDAYEATRDADGNVDPVTGTIGAVSTFLPPPWNLVATGISGLVVGLVKSGIEKRKARNMAAAIEAAKAANPDGAAAFFGNNAARAALDMMGDGAKRIVDSVQGKPAGLSAALPV